jgi:hypothetical protein
VDVADHHREAVEDGLAHGLEGSGGTRRVSTRPRTL